MCYIKGFMSEISSGLWVIVTVPIIMQLGLSIIVLAREPELVFHVTDCDIGLSKRLIIRLPNHLPVFVGHRLRCSQMIEMIKIQGARVWRRCRGCKNR